MPTDSENPVGGSTTGSLSVPAALKSANEVHGTLAGALTTHNATFGSLLSTACLDDLCDLARTAPPGAFVEVGVYRGGSAIRLYEIAEQQNRTLYLFDTFAGHSIVDPEHDDPGIHHVGRFDDGPTVSVLRIRMPRAIFGVGSFPLTLGATGPIAFVHSDADLYWPTHAVCELLVPRMVSGGMLLFDDYGYDKIGCPGVREVVDAMFGPPAPEDIRPGSQRLVRIP